MSSREQRFKRGPWDRGAGRGRPQPWIKLLFFLSLGGLLKTPSASAVGVNYLSGKALGIPVQIIQVDPHLPSIRITPAVCPNFPQGREEWAAFLERTRPRAAITGTPFGKPGERPFVDIVIAGKTVNLGQRGTSACFGEGGRVVFQRISPQAALNWSYPYPQAALGGGPKLLTQGAIDLRPYEEGFRASGELVETEHTALGLTKDGLLLLVHIQEPVDLFQLAGIMKRLGCIEAMNLGNGETCGLAFEGQTLKAPGSPISYALLVFDDPDTYAAAQPHLVPIPPSTASPTSPPPTSPPPGPSSSPVRIVQPVSGTRVTERTRIRVLVQPQRQRTYTVLYVDGEFRSASNIPPYDFRFDPARYGAGEHTIEARLYTSNWELLAQDQILLTVPPPEKQEEGKPNSGN